MARPFAGTILLVARRIRKLALLPSAYLRPLSALYKTASRSDGTVRCALSNVVRRIRHRHRSVVTGFTVNFFTEDSDYKNRSDTETMTTKILTMSPYPYSSVTRSGTAGKVYVPVNPSAVVYAQFDHISGVAASSGQHGVSLTKLQILNSLIYSLNRIQNAPSTERHNAPNSGETDALIAHYQKQIAAAVRAPAAPFLLSGAQPAIGTLFRISA